MFNAIQQGGLILPRFGFSHLAFLVANQSMSQDKMSNFCMHKRTCWKSLSEFACPQMRLWHVHKSFVISCANFLNMIRASFTKVPKLVWSPTDFRTLFVLWVLWPCHWQNTCGCWQERLWSVAGNADESTTQSFSYLHGLEWVGGRNVFLAVGCGNRLFGLIFQLTPTWAASGRLTTFKMSTFPRRGDANAARGLLSHCCLAWPVVHWL